jgi:hypothetical protein
MWVTIPVSMGDIISRENYFILCLTKKERYNILDTAISYATIIPLYYTTMSSMFIAAKYMPSKRVTGPFPVSVIDDNVCVRVVKEQGVPITLYENRDGVERYAILSPPGKEMRVVCNGCFKLGMSLFDDHCCQRISSYCQHWDTKGGVRKHICKAEGEDTLEAAELRLQGTVATEPMDELTVDLSTTESRDLVFELLKREEDFKWILPKCDDGMIVTEARNRGIKTIYECHLNDLEAELRRRLDPTRPTVK